MTRKHVEPYQLRVQQERISLAARLDLLTVFITENEMFKELPEEEQALLERQRKVMREYLDILDIRIAA